jgi:very-short-patch-repair endonuclease
MKSVQTHNIPKLMASRKQLRNSATPEEILLWEHIKASKTGWKFRRQHSVDNVIIDFYCSAKKVAVEIDGAHHFTEDGKANDILRTQHLNAHDIKVIRFTNSEVTNDVRGVVARIVRYIESL